VSLLPLDIGGNEGEERATLELHEEIRNGGDRLRIGTRRVDSEGGVQDGMML